jgi:Flp pilus assembly protein TadG
LGAVMWVHGGTPCRQAAFRRFDEDGAAAVEFALVLPVLAMLLLGLITSGIAFGHAIGLANAVREGSRFGATATPSGATPYTGAQWTAWANDVNSRTRAMQMDDPSHESTVCARLSKNSSSSPAVPTTLVSVCDNGAPAAGTPPTPPSIPGNSCFVTVWATRNFTVNALLVRINDVTERHSLARYERTC